jgi:hypothetical protein
MNILLLWSEKYNNHHSSYTYEAPYIFQLACEHMSFNAIFSKEETVLLKVELAQGHMPRPCDLCPVLLPLCLVAFPDMLDSPGMSHPHHQCSKAVWDIVQDLIPSSWQAYTWITLEWFLSLFMSVQSRMDCKARRDGPHLQSQLLGRQRQEQSQFEASPGSLWNPV